MEDKTILIGGCSFSESMKGRYFNVKNEEEFFKDSNFNSKKDWYPWTDLFHDEFGENNNIINVSKGSAGQSTIVSNLMQKLFELNFKVDKVIVQWSNTARIFAEKESDLIENLNSQGFELLANKGIDIFTKEYYEKIEKMGFDINFNSLTQILLFKNILKVKNIPYSFFWGWDNCLDKKYNQITKEIYDDNFWLYTHGTSENKHLSGGFLEYVNDALGHNGEAEMEDGHPNSASHKLFYNEIIKPKIIRIIKNNFVY